MEKLKLFRQFYLLVVTYIYFTRIIVYLMDATLPFRWVWLGEFFTELATLAFWCITWYATLTTHHTSHAHSLTHALSPKSYKFRPVPDNPYFKDLSDDEGPDDDQAELSAEEGTNSKQEQKGLEVN